MSGLLATGRPGRCWQAHRCLLAAARGRTGALVRHHLAAGRRAAATQWRQATWRRRAGQPWPRPRGLLLACCAPSRPPVRIRPDLWAAIATMADGRARRDPGPLGGRRTWRRAPATGTDLARPAGPIKWAHSSNKWRRRAFLLHWAALEWCHSPPAAKTIAWHGSANSIARNQSVKVAAHLNGPVTVSQRADAAP